MKVPVAVLFFTLLTSVAALAIDDANIAVRAELSSEQELWKRRGGGGGGGRGGGSSGGGSRGGSGSGSSGGSSGSSGGSRSSNTQGTSNAGGTSSGGSGAPRQYGGGRYYGGGATTPYQSGSRSPSGLVPGFFLGSALFFWPGVWLYGAHVYDYKNEVKFHNATTNRDESKPVKCACAQYAVCGCDEQKDDDSYIKELIGDGTYSKLNKSVINVADYNGRSTILLNGTLPNGTTADSAAPGMYSQPLGLWPVIGSAIVAAVFML